MAGMNRRLFLATLGAAATRAGLAMAQTPAAAPLVDVYKSASCGCCGDWVIHMEKSGFRTKVTNLSDDDLADVKTQRKVPLRAQSCHTAIVSGYIVEGHVPASDVKRLLKERPAVVGVAVPGMPIGAPGMEMGNTVKPYKVVTFDKAGELKVYASYGG